MHITLEFLGRINTVRPKFKTKRLDVIFLDNLKNKNKINQTILVMPYRAGNYDYCKDIQELFINQLQLRTFVTRAKNKKSNTFTYHIYLFKN